MITTFRFDFSGSLLSVALDIEKYHWKIFEYRLSDFLTAVEIKIFNPCLIHGTILKQRIREDSMFAVVSNKVKIKVI